MGSTIRLVVADKDVDKVDELVEDIKVAARARDVDIVEMTYSKGGKTVPAEPETPEELPEVPPIEGPGEPGPVEQVGPSGPPAEEPGEAQEEESGEAGGEERAE